VPFRNMMRRGPLLLGRVLSIYGRGGLQMLARDCRGGSEVPDLGRRVRQAGARTDRWATPCVADDEPGSSKWRFGLRGRPWCAQRLGKAQPGRQGGRGTGAASARRGVCRPDLIPSASV
jgi:hypothetical protein